MKNLLQSTRSADDVMNENFLENVDFSLTTWEGARREQLRRWSELPLERIIFALEEMQQLSALLNKPNDKAVPK
jgi:hypothetical protein